ncbi:MAG TPA: hypothetical protein GXX59_11265 [Syntrophomonadaceae bacterium]|nr:hypothetical protein [Syntrophomonadaceae bacterium]
MNVTCHAGTRYCQRILGFEEKEAKKYYKDNKEELDPKISKIQEEGELIFTGAFGEFPECDYYINGDIVMPCRDGAILTVYRAEYGFDDKLNDKITSELVKEIKRLKKRYQKEGERIAKRVERRQRDIDLVDSDIANVEKNLSRLKEKKELIERQLQLDKAQQDSILDDIRNLAYKLCYSVNFRMEMLAMRRG